MVQEDSEELIQLINPEQESELKPEDLPEELSILPIKNTVLFPGVVIPITVTRQKSIKLIKKAYQGNRIIGVLAQKNKQAEEPGTEDLYRSGTVARIIKKPKKNSSTKVVWANSFLRALCGTTSRGNDARLSRNLNLRAWIGNGF